MHAYIRARIHSYTTIYTPAECGSTPMLPIESANKQKFVLLAIALALEMPLECRTEIIIICRNKSSSTSPSNSRSVLLAMDLALARHLEWGGEIIIWYTGVLVDLQAVLVAPAPQLEQQQQQKPH